MKRLFFLLIASFMMLVTMAQSGDAFYGGPYIMKQQVEVPASCAKVVVMSNPLMSGGSVKLKNLETGVICTLYGSVTYVDKWYFIVPNGSYEVVEITSNYVAHINAQVIGVGSIVKFSHASGGYVLFEPK